VKPARDDGAKFDGNASFLWYTRAPADSKIQPEERNKYIENMPQHVPPDAASFSSSAPPNGGVAGKAETGKRGRSLDDREQGLPLVEIK
jgi:hypothetical protein